MCALQAARVVSVLVLLFSVPIQAAELRMDGRTYDVIIVGGGIAGLAAAFYLADYDFLVLEKEAQAGGRAASGQYKGMSYAKGPEYLGLPEFPLEEIIASLDLTLREVPAPADMIYHRKKIYSGEPGKARLLTGESSFEEYNRFARKDAIRPACYDSRQLPAHDKAAGYNR